MTFYTLDQSSVFVPNLGPGLGKSAAMLGLSAGLEGVEMELHNLLIDERTKSESHRSIYQLLKVEYASLQEESQDEMKRLQVLVAKQQAELLDQTRELEELQPQAMTPHRQELLRAQLQQEMEAPFRKWCNKLDEELEWWRSMYYKVEYNNIHLSSQLEQEREEHARILEERRIRHEAEISYLQKDRDDLVAQYNRSDTLRDAKRVETLLGEKMQLHVRLKGLEAEVAEVRAERDNSVQQAESAQRVQIRQLSESQAALKMLEAERQSLRQQLERMESELHLRDEENSQLSRKLHKAEREVNALTFQIGSLQHSHKLKTASVKLEFTRVKGELERERDSLQGQIEGLQADAEMLNAAMARHKEVLVVKEQELVRKVQSAREEEILKTAALHEEKLELENRLAALQTQRALQDVSDHGQKEEWEERLRNHQQGEESARRELQNLRNKVQQQSSQLDELESLKAELSEVQQQNHYLGIQLGTLSDAKSDLMETVDRMREELQAARAQAEKSQHMAERSLEDHRVEWLEEKNKLQEKYRQLKEKLQRAAEAQKKRKRQKEEKEKTHQDKVQLLEAKIEELEQEAAAAKRRSSFSMEQAQLRRRLKEQQQRRNGEFQRLLLGGQGPLRSDPALLTSSPNPFLVSGPEGRSSSNPQEEFSARRRRLEDLEKAQQQQLEELSSLVQSDL